MELVNKRGVANPGSFPLVQEKQSTLFEACGFPCAPAGKHEFSGRMVPMWRATGERRPPAAEVIGYGGAAFGGKSYGMLLLARVAAELWPGVQIAYFRRTYPELDGPGAAMPKAHGVFGDVAHATDGGKEWHWPNGSAFYFRHCQTENDVYSYQSQQIDILLIDEATHFTWMIMDYLLTRNRASGDVKVPGFRPFAVMCSNPGNVGHVWYSQIFDVDGPNATPPRPHEQVKKVANPNGKFTESFFIPAFLSDNQIGVAADPDYEERLMQRDIEISRALLKADWKIFAGQAFRTWTKERVACKHFEIPEYWPRWRAMDYGFVHPMVAGWVTVNPKTKRFYVYRAVSQDGLSDSDQASLIKMSTPANEKMTVTYASPDMWAQTAKKNNRETSVDEFKKAGIILTRADDDRLNGKRKIDRLLMDALDGLPMIQVFEDYYDIFKCMTTLIRDPRRPEDALKVEGDDPYDMLRYLLTNVTQPENKPGEKNNHPGKGVQAI